MEASTGSRQRAEDSSKEDLLIMFLKLEVDSKVAAEEQAAQSNAEKDMIKQKAIALLKRCKDLEVRQGEFEEMKSKVEKYELSASLKTDENQSEQPAAGGTEQYALLQREFDLKVLEAAAARAEASDLNNQGNIKCYH